MDRHRRQFLLAIETRPHHRAAKGELIALLDRAAALKLNAVIFQVRPAGDALYPSELEPWSEYLTGVQGRAPSPYYDPLAFAHHRGAQARFGTARMVQSFSRASFSSRFAHCLKSHQQDTSGNGSQLWPVPLARSRRPRSARTFLRVVMDVLKRYDVDGIHFDDYFYPYAETNSAGAKIDFPDWATWKKYGMSSGLSRDDWRRHNVDVFMEQTYRASRPKNPGLNSASARSASGGQKIRRASRVLIPTRSFTPTP